MRAERGVLFVLSFALGGAGCRASVKADANVAASRQHGRADDWNVPPKQAGSENDADKYDGDAASGTDVAMLGARHDLRLNPDVTTLKCKCLAVALGGPADAAMSWRSTRASIDPRSQLVIAFSSEAQSCPGAPRDSFGASYWGYRISGDDVVVVIEAARYGRPITTGAIIPKPSGQGQVLLQPLTRDLPYGQSLNGQDMCRLGNPVRERSE